MNTLFKISLCALTFVSFISCAANTENKYDPSDFVVETPAELDTAIFASGCFWCTEAVFERVKGVHNVVSGYTGGVKENPTYREVSAGITRHAEAVRVFFDPTVVSYQELAEMFFASHDPTQVNRQGPDVGPQYRTEIFYRTNEQKETASRVKEKLNSSGKYDKPIATKITAFTNFYDAEDYHQNYYEIHPNQSYIYHVSRPKVEKFVKEYKDKLKDQYKTNQ